MGIYIKGMKPSDGCLDCVLRLANRCELWKNVWAAAANSSEKCPIIPIPPHGRLIDASALIDSITVKYIRHERNSELVFTVAEIKQDLADIINELPTIIPAEEGE